MGYVVWCFHATVHTLSAQWMDIERMDLVAQFAFSLLFIGWWLYCCSVHIRFIYLYICVLDTTILYLFNVHHQLFCAVFYFSPLLCCYGAMREAHQNHNTHHPSGHSKAWLPAKLFQMWNCSTTQKFISLVFVGWFDWPAAHITHTKSKMPCWMWFVFVFFYFFIVFCVCCYYTGTMNNNSFTDTDFQHRIDTSSARVCMRACTTIRSMAEISLRYMRWTMAPVIQLFNKADQ